jgi:aminoglycoside phosphotransferase
MKEYGKYQVFSILEWTDKEASYRLQRVWKNGLEYSHADAVTEAKDISILAKSVRITRDLKNMTCPIKSLVIFVHNKDITYE